MDFTKPTITASDEQLRSLTFLVRKLWDKQQLLIDKENEVKELKKEIEYVSSEEIPSLMDTLGMSSIKTIEGQEVTVGTKIYASIPKMSQEAAHAWLQDNGLGDIVKNEFKVIYKRGEQEEAVIFEEYLMEKDEFYKKREFVEPGTLKATLRELIESGGIPPSHLFTIFNKRETKIK